ncbi:hypothetical protein AVEN_235038-1 [Araneus ventricosus]|uniref:Uncharacterized protein n=1 Tax=Araneus ventricosus TaxID=182803 RepID=A0A4Y2BYY5_ARAVE|nr:hypothetical protein AVEN_235038-1 [Araneus ventricosus]
MMDRSILYFKTDSIKQCSDHIKRILLCTFEYVGSGLEVSDNIVRSPKIPQIISGNFFSHAMGHRTEQVPQREVLIKTPPKGTGFESNTHDGPAYPKRV